MKLSHGKYEFYIDPSGILMCSRYGEEWRNFVGDNAVLALYRYAEELEQKLKEVTDATVPQRLVDQPRPRA